MSDVINGVVLNRFGPLHLALGPNRLDGSISLQFLLETRLQSECFDTLINLLVFLVQTLWSIVNKVVTGTTVIRWLLCLLTLYYNFWTRIARKPIKVSKDTDSSLVSNKNFSEILLSNGWAQVRYQQAKKAKTCVTYNVTCKKSKPKTKKIFFHCRLKD